MSLKNSLKLPSRSTYFGEGSGPAPAPEGGFPESGDVAIGEWTNLGEDDWGEDGFAFLVDGSDIFVFCLNTDNDSVDRTTELLAAQTAGNIVMYLNGSGNISYAAGVLSVSDEADLAFFCTPGVDRTMPWDWEINDVFDLSYTAYTTEATVIGTYAMEYVPSGGSSDVTIGQNPGFFSFYEDFPGQVTFNQTPAEGTDSTDVFGTISNGDTIKLTSLDKTVEITATVDTVSSGVGTTRNITFTSNVTDFEGMVDGLIFLVSTDAV